MKANVLQLIGSFHSGGSERQAIQLARLVQESGRYNVHMGCLDRSGSLADDVNWRDRSEIPEFKLTSFYDLNFARQVLACVRYVNEHRIELIHTHDFYTNIFGMTAALVARMPVRIASKRETFSKGSNQMWVERQAFALADRIIVNAEAVKNFLKVQGVREEKVTTIYNGLDLSKFQVRVDRDPARITASNKLPTDPNVSFITIVANMRSEVKNHRMFLRAARRVGEKVSNAEFILAGEGELADSLRRYADELGMGGTVHFVGGGANIPDLLSISSVCVLSSRSEGFSNSILEYMAAGKPVVATEVGGAAEAVMDGETGFLVKPDDDAEMSRRITELLACPEKADRFGKRGRQIAENKFSLSNQLSRTLELYEATLEKRSEKKH